MITRFLHCADIHLGYQQYGRKERFNDFAQALNVIVDQAIVGGDSHAGRAVDFVILAGDLFHKRSIDALTLNQAVRALQRLRDKQIPCIAVEGNHERSYYEETIGWMKFLALQDLLILLDAEFVDGKPQLRPWDPRRRQGSYIDMQGGVRIHGLRYYGSGTPLAVAEYAQAISETERSGVGYTIFVAHAGVEGQLDDKAGGLTHSQWEPLHPFVDYLALGHFHKPFRLDNWIFNPGSPENCSIAESFWTERGYLLVEADTEKREHPPEPAPRHHTKIGNTPRRACRLYRFDCDSFATPDALMAALVEFLTRSAAKLNAELKSKKTQEFGAPIVELYLSGVLAFDRSALDFGEIELALESAFSPLVAIVKNLTQATAFEIEFDATQTRAELERTVLSGIFARDARYAPESVAWAQLTVELKQLALNGASPAAILDTMTARIAQIKNNGQSDSVSLAGASTES